MSEIAAGVRDLREQAGTAPTASDAEPEEGPAEDSEGTAVVPAAASSPVAPEAGTAGVSAASATGVRFVLPPVVDLAPELAAFTTALTQQNRATLQAFRQLTGLCQSQQQHMERMAREIETLTFRVNRIPH